jgi:uncharacterized Tic20 family protein
MKTQPTSEEKFWAVLSHLAALAPGMGMIIPAFGWAENRKKSGYAAFQSLQALGYQSLGFTLLSLLYLLVFTILFFVMIPLTSAKPQNSLALTIVTLIFVLISFGLFGIYLFIPMFGAVLCALGRDFRYHPILGDRLARSIDYVPAADEETPLNNLNQERFAASMGHFSVVFPLWGLLVPLAFWATMQRGHSRFLRFQALQTLVYQVLTTLVSIALFAGALLIFVIALIPILVTKTPGQPPIETLFGIFIFLICSAVVVLIVPLFQIIGQWAGLRILQGHDYRYPILGRLLENWLAGRDKV